MNLFDFILFDSICFIIKIIICFIIFKIYKLKKKNDFLTHFDFDDDDNDKSILDIDSSFDNLDSREYNHVVNEEKL